MPKLCFCRFLSAVGVRSKYLTLSVVPIGEIHACKDEDGAEEEPDGNLLVEEPPSEEDGGDGVEIDPVGSNDGAEFADDPVPDEVAEH